jgi:hypothetical protein
MEDSEGCKENPQGIGSFVRSFTSAAPIACFGKPQSSCQCDSEMFAFAVRGSFSFEVQLFPTTSSPKAKEAKETKEEQDGICSSGPNGICASTPTGTGIIAVLR